MLSRDTYHQEDEKGQKRDASEAKARQRILTNLNQALKDLSKDPNLKITIKDPDPNSIRKVPAVGLAKYSAPRLSVQVNGFNQQISIESQLVTDYPFRFVSKTPRSQPNSTKLESDKVVDFVLNHLDRLISYGTLKSGFTVADLDESKQNLLKERNTNQLQTIRDDRSLDTSQRQTASVLHDFFCEELSLGAIQNKYPSRFTNLEPIVDLIKQYLNTGLVTLNMDDLQWEANKTHLLIDLPPEEYESFKIALNKVSKEKPDALSGFQIIVIPPDLRGKQSLHGTTIELGAFLDLYKYKLVTNSAAKGHHRNHMIVISDWNSENLANSVANVLNNMNGRKVGCMLLTSTASLNSIVNSPITPLQNFVDVNKDKHPGKKAKDDDSDIDLTAAEKNAVYSLNFTDNDTDRSRIDGFELLLNNIIAYPEFDMKFLDFKLKDCTEQEQSIIQQQADSKRERFLQRFCNGETLGDLVKAPSVDGKQSWNSYTFNKMVQPAIRHLHSINKVLNSEETTITRLITKLEGRLKDYTDRSREITTPINQTLTNNSSSSTIEPKPVVSVQRQYPKGFIHYLGILDKPGVLALLPVSDELKNKVTTGDARLNSDQYEQLRDWIYNGKQPVEIANNNSALRLEFAARLLLAVANPEDKLRERPRTNQFIGDGVTLSTTKVAELLYDLGVIETSKQPVANS